MAVVVHHTIFVVVILVICVEEEHLRVVSVECLIPPQVVLRSNINLTLMEDPLRLLLLSPS